MDWQAWDVVPELADRRLHERRVSRLSVPAVRRRATERRIVMGRRPALHSALGGGWLCFEGSEEKRRLTPIPPDWLACPADQLELYLAAAKPAVRLRGSVVAPKLAGMDG
jgi:hypothetical protein